MECPIMHAFPRSHYSSPGENSPGSTGPGMHFVQNHVLKLLVINWAEVDVGLQWLPGKEKVRVHTEQHGDPTLFTACYRGLPDSPSDARCDVVLPLVVIAIMDEVLADILHFAAAKGCTVVEPAIQDPCLAGEQLNQFPHLKQKHA